MNAGTTEATTAPGLLEIDGLTVEFETDRGPLLGHSAFGHAH